MLWFYSSIRLAPTEFSGPEPTNWDGPAHRMERVLPDGSAELVINLDEVRRKRFDRSNPNRFDTFHRSWMSGPQPEFILIDSLPRTSMMGVHFKPGGLSGFLKVPTYVLSGQVIELEQIWGANAHDLRDALLETRGIEAKFTYLEAFLQRRLQSRARSPAVAEAMRLFTSETAGPTIAHVARHLGLSHKHLINRFRSEVGLSPKRFCRIQRFQRTLINLQSEPSRDWPDIACATGYYDQAHLINDFRELSGLTPAGYLQHQGADNRFVPVA